MNPKDPNHFIPEVLFVAEGYDDAKKAPVTDVVSTRGLISGTFASLNTGDALKSNEVVDIQSVITEFLQKLEANGKFIVLDKNGFQKGTPNRMPNKLTEEIYSKTINEIRRIFQYFLPEVTIFELFNDMSSIDVVVNNGEIMDISIYPK